MAKQIKHTADSKTMTLDELGAFVQDAMRSGATGNEVVRATVSLGGKVKTVTVDVVVPMRRGVNMGKEADR